jgi:cellulose synthase operon protein B
MFQSLALHWSACVTRTRVRAAALCFLLGLSLTWICSAATAATNANANTTLTFGTLGAGNMDLRGLQTTGYVNFGIRGDQVITAAKLHLHLTYSPAMLPELSHLRVSLNQQILAALPLPKEHAGEDVERIVELDPRFFTDYNQLRFELIGHYTLQCEDPQNSSLWLFISPQSWLELTVRPLELRNDLALLPAPFFDRRDNQKLALPVVLPTQPSMSMVHAAGIAASWFGALADYRSARFPVLINSLPDRHALVFATNAALPAALKLTAVNEPTISVIDNPANPSLKLLVFQGRDDAQLEDAVTALTVGNPAFSGAKVTVKGVKTTPRDAYDVPRWLRSDRAVKLGELVDSNTQLQTTGIAPAPIGINLRLPPDLFTWDRSGVPLDLHYRYTAPIEQDNSLLNISINNQLLRSFRLKADSQSGVAGKLRVPLLSNSNALERESLIIPAFQLASNNQMQFQFALEYHHDGLCREVFTNPTREAIDPDSSIDISDFAHYTAMPNLALFANAGFPFSRYADLSHTGIVLPDMKPNTLEQLLFVLGRMGRHTGLAATQYRLLTPQQTDQAKKLDLILLSGDATNQLLDRWRQNLSLRIDGNERRYQEEAGATAFSNDALRLSPDASHDNEVSINGNGELGAFISFESPLSSSHTVVAFTASDDAAAQSLLAALEDDGKVALIRGDLVIVRGADVQSFQGDQVYYVGSLSWWIWLWFHLSRHPVLLTLLAIGMAIVVAMLVYGWLQRRLQRRMGNTAE